jgi:hypothetical protein
MRHGGFSFWLNFPILNLGVTGNEIWVHILLWDWKDVINIVVESEGSSICPSDMNSQSMPSRLFL